MEEMVSYKRRIPFPETCYGKSQSRIIFIGRKTKIAENVAWYGKFYTLFYESVSTHLIIAKIFCEGSVIHVTSKNNLRWKFLLRSWIIIYTKSGSAQLETKIIKLCESLVMTSMWNEEIEIWKQFLQYFISKELQKPFTFTKPHIWQFHCKISRNK